MRDEKSEVSVSCGRVRAGVIQRENGRKVQAGQVEKGGGTPGWLPTQEKEALSPAQLTLRPRSHWKTWPEARAPGYQGPRLRSFHRESEPTPERLQAQVPCKINRHQNGDI